MRKFKINLTKSVEASVYFDENDVQNTTPKLVSIKPRSGVDSSVTSYSINKLSANIKIFLLINLFKIHLLITGMHLPILYLN